MARRWLPRLVLLGLTFLHLHRVQSAQISSFAWSDETAGASTTVGFILDLEAEEISPDASLRITLHSLLEASAELTATLLVNSNAASDTGVSVDTANKVLTFIRDGSGPPLSSDDTLEFEVIGLTNPKFTAALSPSGSVGVFDNTGAEQFVISLNTVHVSPGSILTSQVAFTSLLVGRASDVELQFSTTNGLSADGGLSITMPHRYVVHDGITVSGLDGVTEIFTTPESYGIKIKRSGGTVIPPLEIASIVLTGLVHPNEEGSLEDYIRVDTFDSSDRLIDQGHVDASTLVLKRAKVVADTLYLQGKEGTTVDYSIHLTDPPVSASIMFEAVCEDCVGISVSPDQIHFDAGNFADSQTLTVTFAQDDTFSSGQHGVIKHVLLNSEQEPSFRPSGASVYVEMVDDDLPAVSSSKSFLLLSENVDTGYTIVLLSEPTEDVTVSISEGTNKLDISPTSVVFTSATWNTPQEITVSVSSDENNADSRLQIDHSVASEDAHFHAARVTPSADIQVYFYSANTPSCSSPCLAGHYSFLDTNSGSESCVDCPQGYFCTGDCAPAVPCPVGTSSSTDLATSASVCEQCPEGFYAPVKGQATCWSCPAGAKCPDPTNTFEKCPAGSYSNVNEIECHDCAPGTYNPNEFQETCLICPTGKFCEQGATSPSACSSDTFSFSSGASSCESCLAGYGCDADTGATPCGSGTYSLDGETSCITCPKGFFCATTDEAPRKCSLGLYSTEGSLECQACLPGYKCPDPTINPIPCELGTYNSVEKATDCWACPAGYSCSSVSQDPVTCASGTYSAAGDYTCRPCPAGKSCLDSALDPEDCTPGTVSLEGEATCTDCPAGFICADPAQDPATCSNGQYVVNGTSCVDCEPGFFCPSPSELPQPCPSNTYSTGRAAECQTCPDGNVCLQDGTVYGECPFGQIPNPLQTECIPCPAGYSCTTYAKDVCSIGTYSIEGDGSCRACPLGHKCFYTTTEPIPCASGSYAPVNSTECFTCLPGFYCPEPTMEPIACPLGHYSTASSTACLPCPPGYDCSSPSSEPTKCPLGTYSLSSGSTCLDCPPGAYCSDPTLTPIPCQPGTFSIGGQQHCTPCESGHSCPHPDQNVQIACTDGTYAEAGASSCVVCPAGKQCPDTTQKIRQECTPGFYALGGQSQCTSCPIGMACPALDGSENHECEFGTYSPGGSTKCISCPAGFECPTTAIATPTPCPFGQYSVEGSPTCTKCRPGYACPDSETDHQELCAVGTYSDEGAGVCSPCPAGYECPLPTADALELCDAGWYSPAGISTCLSCPRGYYCEIAGASPQNCSVGYYSLDASTSCIACEPGYECPRTDQLPQPCPVGYYSEGMSITCKQCNPGYKCGLASASPTPPEDACPEGGYCNPPTTFFLCPAGTFGNTTAGESVEQACAPCPEGFYCEMGSTRSSMMPCPAGFFCPESTKRSTQFACPAGTYNPDANAKSIAECTMCPQGSYCPTATGTPIVCVQGHYCPEGTKDSNEYPCPQGTYSGPTTGLSDASQCLDCTAGYFCPLGSINPTSCPAGTYNPSTGTADLHECLDCPPGWSCPHVAQINYEDRCSAGHYCPVGTVLSTTNPCPAGSYTDSIGLIRAEDCTTCPARKACPKGTGGDLSPMVDCAVGHFCPEGTEYASQFDCPPGSYTSSISLASPDECDICPKGKYCVGGQDHIDGDCSPGHYCPLGTASPTAFPCPAGTFTPDTWLFEEAQCEECPPGFYCPLASVEPIPCKAGSYTGVSKTEAAGPGVGFPECTLCPAGYYCESGFTVPLVCGKGYYSTAGSEACLPCTAGHFCASTTTSKANMLTIVDSWNEPGALYGTCYRGAYCPEGTDHEPTLEQDACPRTFYCPAATVEPVVCPAGTYSNLTGQDALDDCSITPPGYFSLEGVLEPTGSCQPGFYCPPASTGSMQIPCPPGYYLNRTNGGSEEDCAVCVAGGYCPQASWMPLDCPTGYYCRTGVSVPEPCPIGTYSNMSRLKQVEDCLACPPGMYCDSTGLTHPRGLCDAGHYCTLGAYTSAPMNFETTLFGVSTRHVGAPCPPGTYCPLGSALPSLCPPGTFSTSIGLSSEVQCTVCTPGKYCETPGLTAPTDDCLPGYFCTGGANVPTQVDTPAGYFTESGAASAVACPPSQYNNNPNRGSCLPCPAGYFCDAPATITPTLCPVGHFCPNATSLAEKCPPGTFSTLEGLAKEDQCESCTPGYYCSAYGLSSPTGPCLAGYVCKGASTVANPDADHAHVGEVCPPGYYCPEASGEAIACPLGTYRGGMKGMNMTACASCPGGKYCGQTGLAAPSGDCKAGYYCVESAPTSTPTDGSTGDICPEGYYCPLGSAAPIKCSASTYADSVGFETCLECPEGFFCDGKDTTLYQDCPVGYYCPPATGAFPVACPVGTLNSLTKSINETACALCPLGSYCDTEGIFKPSGNCKRGFYCEYGSINEYGWRSENDTHICPPGHYCPESTYIPLPCPLGTYSNMTQLTSALECIRCDQGTYCGSSGLIAPSGFCTAGYFCKHMSAESTPTNGVYIAYDTINGSSQEVLIGGDVCTKGHYCPEGSFEPIPCPEGSYANVTNLEECYQCPPGYYCPLGSIDYIDYPCPIGYYCLEGTKRAIEYPCPPGTYSNTTELRSEEECTPAPGGMYADSYAAIEPAGYCESGFYCTSGSQSATPVNATLTGGPCLPGTNCPSGSAVPIVCDAGFYCSSSNTEQASPCMPGFYCAQGSYTASPTGQINSLGIIGDVCPPGHYCLEATSNPIPCAPGTFSTSSQNDNIEDCLPCPPGMLCSTSGIAEPEELCTEGYICRGGEATATELCPLGASCPPGSSSPEFCSAGSYSDEKGLAECKPCPARYFCDMGSIQPEDCKRGYYCPVGTSSMTMKSCPAGTYGHQELLADATECAVCPRGEFCDGNFPTNQTSGACAPSHYCLSGSNTSTPLDDAMGGLCSEGYMCTGGAFTPEPKDNVTGRVCDTGHFCSVGSSSQVPCPKGTFNSIPGQPSCEACPVGMYCGLGSVVPELCPIRYYCPAGVTDPILCPSGTFGQSEGLSDASECAECIGGQYCRSGLVTAPCAAGYYCRASNEDPVPVNLSTVDRDLGGPCPIGHYCPEGADGPIACPSSTANLDILGESLEDCRPCPAGFSCDEGANTVPCPPGNYCPYAVSVQSCPQATYNAKEGMVKVEDCEPCEAGKWCNSTAIVDPQNLLCPRGHYCQRGAIDITPCPSGYFGPVAGLRSKEECSVCTPGSYCQVGTIEPVVCPSKTYCPVGSGEPTMCPGGGYCPSNSSTPVICPAGYYCKQETDLPLVCPHGHFCPAGSEAPMPCPLGYIGRVSPLAGIATSIDDTCKSCPPGTYGDDPYGMTCSTCLEGYVCLGATTTPYPTNVSRHRGYACPQGQYCPAGSSDGIECPKGTYQPETKAVNSSACLPCKENSYQHLRGQGSCFPCSTSALSQVGAERCTCVGAHRAFQMTDGFCICEPGFEFYDENLIRRSDEDGSVDCQPIVYDRCQSGQVRLENGACVSASTQSCDDACGDGLGEFIPSLGLCQCSDQMDVNDICDVSCRKSAPKVVLDGETGRLQVRDPVTGRVSEVQESAGIVSNVFCPSNDLCEFQSLNLLPDGFAGSFDIPPSISVSSEANTSADVYDQRRLLTAEEDAKDGIVRNPMLCLRANDGIVFDLSTTGSYPVYIKDSMLNTNPTFDYGAFRSLADRIKTGANNTGNSVPISTFVFSFNEPGTYVFGNSVNADAKTVVVVMRENTKCPLEASIVPMSEKNLIAVSAKRRVEDIILAPDWNLIGGLLGGVFAMIASIIGGLFVFRTKSWVDATHPSNNVKGYRERCRESKDLLDLHSKGTTSVKKGTKLSAVAAIESTGTQPGEDNAGDMLPVAKVGVGRRRENQTAFGYEDDWENEVDDLGMLVQKLQHHHENVAKVLEETQIDTSQNVHRLEAETREMKRLLVKAFVSDADKTENGHKGGCTGKVLELVEKEIQESQRARGDIQQGLADARSYLDEVDKWDTKTVAADLLQDIMKDESTNDASDKSEVLETLGRLKLLLNADPASSTSSSLFNMCESSNAKKELSNLLLESSLDSDMSQEVQDVLAMRKDVLKGQNLDMQDKRETLEVLRRYGDAAQKSTQWLQEREEKMAEEYLKLKEEQNPAKLSNWKREMEGQLAAFVLELKGASKKVKKKLKDGSGSHSRRKVESAEQKTLDLVKGMKKERQLEYSSDPVVPYTEEKGDVTPDILLEMKEMLAQLMTQVQLQSQSVNSMSSIFPADVSWMVKGREAGKQHLMEGYGSMLSENDDLTDEKKEELMNAFEFGLEDVEDQLDIETLRREQTLKNLDVTADAKRDQMEEVVVSRFQEEEDKMEEAYQKQLDALEEEFRAFDDEDVNGDELLPPTLPIVADIPLPSIDSEKAAEEVVDYYDEMHNKRMADLDKEQKRKRSRLRERLEKKKMPKDSVETALQELEEKLVQEKAALIQELEQKEDTANTLAEQEAESAESELETAFEKCKQQHEIASAKLKAGLALDRQRKFDKLQARLDSRKKKGELLEEEAEKEYTAVANEIASEEAQAIVGLDNALRSDMLDSVQSFKITAEKKAKEMEVKEQDLQNRLEAIRAEHEKAREELEKNVSAEKKQRLEKLRERMEEKRGRLKNSKDAGEIAQEKYIELVQELDVEEDAEYEEVYDELSHMEVKGLESIEEKLRETETELEEVVVERKKVAARQKVLVEYDTEYVFKEYVEGIEASQDEAEVQMREGKKKLMERLARKSGIKVDGNDPDGFMQTEMKRVCEAHIESWMSRNAELDEEEQMRRRKLRDRMRNRRKETRAKSSNETDVEAEIAQIDEEEKQEVLMIVEEVGKERVELEVELENNMTTAVQGMAQLLKNDEMNIEGKLRACREDFEAKKRALQEDTNGLDALRNEKLQERLRQRREKGASSNTVEDAIDEIEQEQVEAVESLFEPMIEQAAERISAAEELVRNSEIELEKLRKENADGMRDLEATIEGDRSRQKEKLLERRERRKKKEAELEEVVKQQKIELDSAKASKEALDSMQLSELERVRAEFMRGKEEEQELERDQAALAKQRIQERIQKRKERVKATEVPLDAPKTSVDAPNAPEATVEPQAMTQDMEKVLASCRQLHEEESEKLRESLAAERKRQEMGIKKRLAKKKQGQQKKEEEKALMEAMLRKEEEAMEALRQSQEEELQLIATEMETLRAGKSDEEIAETVNLELNRMKEEHEKELDSFHQTLASEKKKQESRLQQRLEQKRKRKETRVDMATKEADVVKEEVVDEEDEAEAAVLAERQREKEQRMEEKRKKELDRLRREFNANTEELEQTKSAESKSQKQKLADRIQMKKEKKRMELEAKHAAEKKKLEEERQSALQQISQESEKKPVEEKKEKKMWRRVSQSLNKSSRTLLEADASAEEEEGVRRLIKAGVIPDKLTLVMGVEMVVSGRQEREVKMLTNQQHVAKWKALRLEMTACAEEKAEMKANGQDDEEVETAFEKSMEERKHAVDARMDPVHILQLQQLKNSHVQQVSALVNKFQSLIKSDGREKTEVRYVQRVSEDERLMEEMEVRLQVEAQSKVEELRSEHEKLLVELKKQREEEILGIEDKFKGLMEEERRAIREMLETSARENEQAKQLENMQIMLDGRKADQVERCRRRYVRRIRRCEENLKRKVELVKLNAQERMMEEREAMRSRNQVDGENAQESGDRSMDMSGNLVEVVERLEAIEAMLKVKLDGVKPGVSEERVKPLEQTDLLTDLGVSIERGCNYPSSFLKQLTFASSESIQANVIALNLLHPSCQKRMDFATWILDAAVSTLPALKSGKLYALADTMEWSFDGGNMYLPTACLQQLSPGQLGLLVLHLAVAYTVHGGEGLESVEDVIAKHPKDYIVGLHQVLVKSHQAFYPHVDQKEATVSKHDLSVGTALEVEEEGAWKSRLGDLESFLCVLEQQEIE